MPNWWSYAFMTIVPSVLCGFSSFIGFHSAVGLTTFSPHRRTWRPSNTQIKSTLQLSPGSKNSFDSLSDNRCNKIRWNEKTLPSCFWMRIWHSNILRLLRSYHLTHIDDIQVYVIKTDDIRMTRQWHETGPQQDSNWGRCGFLTPQIC